MAALSLDEIDGETKELLEKYRKYRVPPLDQLVEREMIELIYRGYIDTYNIPMGIFWPTGNPEERDSWVPLRGINDTHFHAAFCRACRDHRAPDGTFPLRARCDDSDRDHALKAVRRKELIRYVCYNGLIDLAVPIILDSVVIAVLFTGQLRPKPGRIWGGTEILGVEASDGGRNVDLWSVCQQRIAEMQKIVGDYKDLASCAWAHPDAGPEKLEEYEKGLQRAARILGGLAEARHRLERSKLRDYFRSQLFGAPLDREEFWAFLEKWVAIWNPPERGFAIGLACQADIPKATITVLVGATETRRGTYPIANMSLWKQLHDLEPGAPVCGSFRLAHLLSGCRLPAEPAVVAPVEGHGFLIYGVRDSSSGPNISDVERASIGSFGRDIGMLLDRIEQAHAREDFLTYFSHELRSPINKANFILERMRKGRYSDPAVFDEKCRRLQAQLNRLLKLIEGVWHLQGVLAGKIHYVPERTNLYEFLAACAVLSKDMSEREDLKIVVDRGSLAGLPMVCLDRPYFELIVFNLLDNAVKYSTPGTEIRIFGRRERNGVDVALAFTNIGIRIPQAEELDVFERFARTDEARELAPESAGIGLFLVKHIVQGHGGAVTAASRPHGRDHLVEFEITLPIKQ